MDLSRHASSTGSRWAVDHKFLPVDFRLSDLLDLPVTDQEKYLSGLVTGEPAAGPLLAPIEPTQEVWASGVTFLRSRQAREAESATADIYQRVYEAQRPELFFKSVGWRVVGPDGAIRIRRDSRWNVPEPELTLLINRYGEICGYCAGNDVSSRDIEGDNPLYLPQAKFYNGSCALGPRVHLVPSANGMRDLPIRLSIEREGQVAFAGETGTHLMKRSLEELAQYLFLELDFPAGVFLMTGTGIVPPETFTLKPGDMVQVSVGDLVLRNSTAG